MMNIATQLADVTGRLLQARVTPDLLRYAEAGNWPTDLWNEIAELGIANALVPAESDGHGLCWQDIAPTLMALGYHACPLPIGEDAIVQAAIARAGLPPVDGISTLPVRQEKPISRRGNGTVSGALHGVPWAEVATHVAFEADDGENSELFHVALAGLAQGPHSYVSRTPHSDVTVQRSVSGAPTRRGALALDGAMLRALQLVGALKRTLKECVDYANTRVQFGKPIGRFQSMQQLIAALGNEVAAANAATAAAAAALDRKGTADLAVAVAKARSSAAAGRAAAIVHEVHAAIGVTEAYHLHFVTRRLWQWRDDFGSEFVWHDIIGKAARRKGAEGLWRFLVAASAGDDEAALSGETPGLFQA